MQSFRGGGLIRPMLSRAFACGVLLGIVRRSVGRVRGFRSVVFSMVGVSAVSFLVRRVYWHC